MGFSRWVSRAPTLLRLRLRKVSRYLRPRLLFALCVARVQTRRLQRRIVPRIRTWATDWGLAGLAAGRTAVVGRLHATRERAASWRTARAGRVVGGAAAFLAACLALMVFGSSPQRGSQASAPDPQPLAVVPAALERTAMLEPELPEVVRDPVPNLAEFGVATEGRDGLVRILNMIRAGVDRLDRVPDYTAVFLKQERIDGILNERDTVELKMRHHPYCIYMNWLEGPDTGREILFAEGKNDGEMLYHAGGWKGRLFPALKVNPTGRTAMSRSRYPVTDLGLVATAKRTIQRRQKNVDQTGGYQFRVEEDADFDGRPCLLCRVDFEDPENDEKYRKSLFWIDRAHLVPIAIRNFGWPAPEAAGLSGDALDEETLLEDYAYVNIRLRQQLADRDFDADNESYRFRRR